MPSSLVLREIRMKPCGSKLLNGHEYRNLAMTIQFFCQNASVQLYGILFALLFWGYPPPSKNKFGRFSSMSKSKEDITEMDRLYGDIRVFKIRAQEELRRARRYAAFVSMISMDLSHIDPVTDIENFVGIDQFMTTLQQLVRSSIRDTDIGAGGGARLLLLLIDTPREGAEALTDRLEKTMRYFMCDNIKSPLNWHIPMKQYYFPGMPGEEFNLQSVLEIIEND